MTLNVRHTEAGGAAQTATSSAFTPAANAKLYVFIHAIASNTATNFSWTVTDTETLTWTNLYNSGDITTPSTNFDASAQVFEATVGASPSSMTVTIDGFSGTEQFFRGWSVVEDPLAQTIANSVYESNGAANDSDTSIDDISLNLGAVPSGEQIYFFSAGSNSTGTHTFDPEPTNFTAGGTDTVGNCPVEVMTSSTNTTQTVGHGFSARAGNARSNFGAFLEFAAAVGAGDSDAAIFNDTAGAVEIDVTDGGDTPTVLDGTGASTIVNNSVNVTFVGHVIDTTPVSRVRIVATDTVGSVTDGDELYTSLMSADPHTYVHGYEGDLTFNWTVRNFSGTPRYRIASGSGTIRSTGAEVNVQQNLY